MQEFMGVLDHTNSPVKIRFHLARAKHNYLLSLCFKAVVAYVHYYVTACSFKWHCPLRALGSPVSSLTRGSSQILSTLLWLENKINFGQGCVVGTKMDLEKNKNLFLNHCLLCYNVFRNTRFVPGPTRLAWVALRQRGNWNTRCRLWYVRVTFVILSVARREN